MIRRATKQDASGIAKVHVDTWKTTYKGIVPDDYLSSLSYDKREQMWKEIITQPEGNSHVWVLTDADERVIGFSSGGKNRDASLPFDGEIYAIYLQQEEHKRGQGKKLFLESLEQLYRDGFYQMILWVLEENPTKQFYEVMGGRPVAEKWEEIGGKQLKEIAYGWHDIFATLNKLKAGFRHPCIKHFSELQEPNNASKTEMFGRNTHIGRFFDFKRLGIHYCVLLPGQRTSLPHAEKTEDEYVLVIKGNPDTWIDGNLYILQPGDNVGFNAGTGICHTFMNNTGEDVHLCVVGDRTRTDNQYFYPLHQVKNKEVESDYWADHPKRPLGSHDGTPNEFLRTESDNR